MSKFPDLLVCSHSGCVANIPRHAQIGNGWTVGRIEENHKNTVTLYYLYLCPLHKLTSIDRQPSLPFTSTLPPSEPQGAT
jgi:hypothetical protein